MVWGKWCDNNVHLNWGWSNPISYYITSCLTLILGAIDVKMNEDEVDRVGVPLGEAGGSQLLIDNQVVTLR